MSHTIHFNDASALVSGRKPQQGSGLGKRLGQSCPSLSGLVRRSHSRPRKLNNLILAVSVVIVLSFFATLSVMQSAYGGAPHLVSQSKAR